MILTCCCGATLDTRSDWATPHVEERFYNAHADCLRKTEDDDAFWLRQYAGQAMQGILASCHEEARDLPLACRCATLSVEYAKALLEEVKKREGIMNG